MTLRRPVKIAAAVVPLLALVGLIMFDRLFGFWGVACASMCDDASGTFSSAWLFAVPLLWVLGAVLSIRAAVETKPRAWWVWLGVAATAATPLYLFFFAFRS